MGWTISDLEIVAASRGERLPKNKWLQEVLLAHERFRGRTDEDYPKGKAERELHRLLDGREDELPSPSGKEFMGLRQLRAYANDRAKAREMSSGRSTSYFARDDEPDHEDEYER